MGIVLGGDKYVGNIGIAGGGINVWVGVGIIGKE